MHAYSAIYEEPLRKTINISFSPTHMHAYCQKSSFDNTMIVKKNKLKSELIYTLILYRYTYAITQRLTYDN